MGRSGSGPRQASGLAAAAAFCFEVCRRSRLEPVVCSRGASLPDAAGTDAAGTELLGAAFSANFINSRGAWYTNGMWAKAVPDNA